MMSLEDCLGAATECDAPMVSICGGEPLIYPHIEALVDGLLVQKRIVYICTNAMFMRKKMREWLTKELRNADTSKRKDLDEKSEVCNRKG
jgi:organic radical activating enzyme